MIAPITNVAGWRTTTASDLTDALNAPAALKRMTLTAFFQAAVAAGADPTELAHLWAYDQYVQRAATALWEGDLAGMQALIATMPPQAKAEMSQETLDAITATVAANTLRAVDVHWPEDSEEDPPAEVTEQDVSGWLTAAGYTWSGDEWVYDP